MNLAVGDVHASQFLMSEKKSRVYLIGAGPGDVGLLTLRGAELLGKAHVVIYDSLVNPDILRFCRHDAELVFAGKTTGRKQISQDEINELLVAKAKEGKTVARLKGGDPFVFGRGGEEAETVVRNGIEIEIVPGVSSVTAVPAYGGIPLTHREYNSSFSVFTGHQGENEDFSLDHYRAETMVFLMGLGNIETIMKKLLDAGKDPATPAAVISRGTLPEQTSVLGTISDIAEKTRNLDMKTPATLLVGEVARLKDSISWYEKKPLFGKTVMVTREKKNCREFSALLGRHGARVVEFPAIEVKPVEKNAGRPLSGKNLETYDFIVFTSVNGVERFFETLASLGKDSRAFGGKTVIAIGKRTAERLAGYNIAADHVPERYTAEGVIELAETLDLRNRKVLVPRALVAREILPETLGNMGAEVDVLPLYETLVPRYGKKELDAVRREFADGLIDLVTFTSSSTVRNFFSLLGKDPGTFSRTEFACIGPVTAATLAEHGFSSAVTARVHTVEKLSEKILDFYLGNRGKK